MIVTAKGWGFKYCTECRGITDGRCACMMYQDGIDTSDCEAHRGRGHTGGGCKCAPKKEEPDLPA
jgi:hypothetical protein